MSTDLKTYKFNHSMYEPKAGRVRGMMLIYLLQDSGEGPKRIRYILLDPNLKLQAYLCSQILLAPRHEDDQKA